jgi:hypothetical protein
MKKLLAFPRQTGGCPLYPHAPRRLWPITYALRGIGDIAIKNASRKLEAQCNVNGDKMLPFII